MNKTTSNSNSNSITDDIMTSETAPSLAPSNNTFEPTLFNEGCIYLFLLGIVSFIMLLMIRIWQIQRKSNEDNDNGNSNGSSNDNSNSNSNGNDWRQSSTGGYSVRTRTVGSNIPLSLEDRIELYNLIFDSNGNQLTLQSKHFVTKITKMNNNDNDNNNNNSGTEEAEEENDRTKSFVDIELGDDVGDDDSSIYLSIESDRNKMNLEYINQSSTTSTTSVRLDPDKEKNSMINNETSCIICFEEFVNDDVIVWSNDSSCHHIYHKECMVQYLATTNAPRKGTTSSLTDRTNNNPCPTCRRPDYCVVSRDDLVQLKATMQPKTTITTTTIGSGNSNSNSNNDDNDETVDEVATTVTVAATVALEATANQ